MSRKTAFEGTIFLGKYWYQKMYILFEKMDELRGQPRFHDVSAFFGLCGLGGSGLRFVPFGQVGLRCCNNTRHPKSRQTRKNTQQALSSGKHRDCLKRIWASFRAWWNRIWLPDASGCVRVLQYQLSSTITCLERKGTTKSKPWKICHLLSRDNKCKFPYLIGWLHARSARRNFCLTITRNSWLVKVSQYYINVSVFLVGVASCVYAGVLGRCGVVDFFCVFPLFFFRSFLFSFFSFSFFLFFSCLCFTFLFFLLFFSFYFFSCLRFSFLFFSFPFSFLFFSRLCFSLLLYSFFFPCSFFVLLSSCVFFLSLHIYVYMCVFLFLFSFCFLLSFFFLVSVE